MEMTNLQIVKNGNDDYSVYAECADGLVEITPQPEESEMIVFDTEDLEEYSDDLDNLNGCIGGLVEHTKEVYGYYDNLPQDSSEHKQIAKLDEAWECINDGLTYINEMLEGNYNMD